MAQARRHTTNAAMRAKTQGTGAYYNSNVCMSVECGLCVKTVRKLRKLCKLRARVRICACVRAWCVHARVRVCVRVRV